MRLKKTRERASDDVPHPQQRVLHRKSGLRCRIGKQLEHRRDDFDG